MKTGVMWRPSGDERRQQRRSGAGRHITVLATQPEQIGGMAIRAEVCRSVPDEARYESGALGGMPGASRPLSSFG